MTDAEREELLRWLREAEVPQREKLAIVRAQHAAPIRALFDDDFAQVTRELEKRINSKKVADELAAVLAVLAHGRVANPRPRSPDAPPVVAVAAPIPPLPGGDDLSRLEAAIAANPDVPDNYVVYGDLLELRGDPHHAQLVANARTLGGRLAGYDDVVTEIVWHRGFIRGCRLANTIERDQSKARRVEVVEVLGWLLDDPGPARFLRQLTVGIVAFGSDGPQTYEGIGRVLARKPRPALHELYLGDFSSEETELNWSSIGDLSALWPQLPALRVLSLRSGSMTVGAIDLPKLERLATITGGLSAESALHIASASWLSLVELSLQYGPESSASLAEVRPILDGPARFPRLRSLGITNFGETDELCDWLPESKILPQLEVLDLSMGTMSDAGAAALQRNRDRFAHLKQLVVDDNYLTARGAELLAGVAQELAFGDSARHAGVIESRRRTSDHAEADGRSGRSGTSLA